MQVLRIRPTEMIHVDQECLGELYSQLGEAGADNVVCRALEELALRMSHCDKLFREEDWGALRKNTRSLIALGFSRKPFMNCTTGSKTGPRWF